MALRGEIKQPGKNFHGVILLQLKFKSFQEKMRCLNAFLKILNLKTGVPKENPVLKTIIGYFRGAEIYERELVDLLGVKVEGLPEGKRYPLPDDWPLDQHPLRKDWKAKCIKS